MKNRVFPLALLLSFAFSMSQIQAGFENAQELAGKGFGFVVKAAQITGTIGGTVWLITKILAKTGVIQDSGVNSPQIGSSTITGFAERIHELEEYREQDKALRVNEEYRLKTLESKFGDTEHYKKFLEDVRGRLETLEGLLIPLKGLAKHQELLEGAEGRLKNLESKLGDPEHYKEFLEGAQGSHETLERKLGNLEEFQELKDDAKSPFEKLAHQRRYYEQFSELMTGAEERLKVLEKQVGEEGALLKEVSNLTTRMLDLEAKYEQLKPQQQNASGGIPMTGSMDDLPALVDG